LRTIQESRNSCKQFYRLICRNGWSRNTRQNRSKMGRLLCIAARCAWALCLTVYHEQSSRYDPLPVVSECQGGTMFRCIFLENGCSHSLSSEILFNRRVSGFGGYQPALSPCNPRLFARLFAPKPPR
jgi:hypothetical protein